MRKRPVGAGSSSGSGSVRSSLEPALGALDQGLGHVVGGGEHGERQAHVVAAPRERELGHVQLAVGETGPVRGRAAVGREGEAADRHQPGARGAVGRVGHRAAGQVAPLRRGAREAPRTGRAHAAHATEAGQRGAVAVGLLEAEPRLAGAAGGEGGRARIHLGADRHGESGEDLSLPPPGAAHGPLGAPQERGAGAGVEGEAAVSGR